MLLALNVLPPPLIGGGPACMRLHATLLPSPLDRRRRPLRTPVLLALALLALAACESAPPTATPTAAPVPTPTATLPAPTPTTPGLHELREYMLGLVNAIRTEEGLPSLTPGDNLAAQGHAEASLLGGFNSHWNLNGLKPGMRYSLAGGYQRTQENVFRSRCSGECDFHPEAAIQKAIEGWMSSPGHRKEILDATHRFLNIGMAWHNDRLGGDYTFHAVAQFEGDYVEYLHLPAMDADRRLTMAGTFKNGVTLAEDLDLSIQVYYERLPEPVTLGQLQRVYGVDPGLYVAKLRPPLPEGRTYTTSTGVVENERRPVPYDIPANSPPAASWDEYGELKAAARMAPTITDASTRHRITADRWVTNNTEFDIEADFSVVLAEYGLGVYEVVVRALRNGEEAIVSEYSIIHEEG